MTGRRAAGDQTGWLEIYVAAHKSYEGRFYHWSIGAYDNRTYAWVVYEAVRQGSWSFKLNTHMTDPRFWSRCEPLVRVGRVDRARYDDVVGAFEAVRITNCRDWNCQDYVLEIVSALVRCGLVCKGDGRATMRRLKQYQGQRPRDFSEAERARQRGRVVSSEYVEKSD